MDSGYTFPKDNRCFRNRIKTHSAVTQHQTRSRHDASSRHLAPRSRAVNRHQRTKALSKLDGINRNRPKFHQPKIESSRFRVVRFISPCRPRPTFVHQNTRSQTSPSNLPNMRSPAPSGSDMFRLLSGSRCATHEAFCTAMRFRANHRYEIMRATAARLLVRHPHRCKLAGNDRTLAGRCQDIIFNRMRVVTGRAPRNIRWPSTLTTNASSPDIVPVSPYGVKSITSFCLA